MRIPLQNHLETWITRLAFVVIPRLSRTTVIRLSRFLGSMGYFFSRKLKRIGMANLFIAFGDEIPVERQKQILRASFKNMALVLLDTFWFSKDTHYRIEHYTSLAPCFDLLLKPKAHMAITAHFGNWEVLGMAVTQRGFNLHSVAKPLKNNQVDILMDQVRISNGQKIIKRDGAVRSMLRMLQQGDKIGLVMDQNVELSEGGLMVPFFGLPAVFSSAGAALAIKTRSDVIFAAMIPLPDGSYLGNHCIEIDIAPYTQGDLATATKELTGRIASEMESLIRKHPEYWLWAYKRWKYIPEGDDPAKYPFYRRAAV